jgi:hypothetical protein
VSALAGWPAVAPADVGFAANASPSPTDATLPPPVTRPLVRLAS